MTPTPTPTRRTREQIEAQAWDDYSLLLGDTILVTQIDSYRDNDHVVIDLDPPVRCTVLPTPEADVVRWLDEWLDPYWNVQPLEQRPELAGTRGWWVYGPSYNLTTGERTPGSWEERPAPAVDSPMTRGDAR